MYAPAPRTILSASWLAIAGLVVPAGTLAQVPPQRATAFVNANVVPMDREGVLADYTVVVSSGRIVEMGPSASVEPPAGAMVIDAAGKYLMPGLAEMHGHMPGGDIEETVMFLYVANGVTTVRGMLGQNGHLALRARANAGEIVAPTLYMAGPSFNDGSVNSPAEAEDTGAPPEARGMGSAEDPSGTHARRIQRHGGHRPGGGNPLRRACAG